MLKAIESIATDDYEESFLMLRVEYAEHYLENLGQVLFGSKCKARIQEWVLSWKNRAKLWQIVAKYAILDWTRFSQIELVQNNLNG